MCGAVDDEARGGRPGRVLVAGRREVLALAHAVVERWVRTCVGALTGVRPRVLGEAAAAVLVIRVVWRRRAGCGRLMR